MGLAEEFRQIRGYNRYLVSNLGNVKSIIRKGRILKPRNNGYGYNFVGLRKDNKTKEKLIHRLVVEAFISEIKDGFEVNHKNGIRDDNKIENLEIVTSSENSYHCYRELGRVGWRKGKKGKELPDSKPVIQYSLDGVKLAEYESIALAIEETNIHRSTISLACSGKSRNGGGYLWKYKNK